ncbi:stage II sporulation protein P [Niallia sp.]|uniref:stage II sporulation protein P n=1 Tax=Niallia sp. TaxID=2837523 RepID=UPI0037C868E6
MDIDGKDYAKILIVVSKTNDDYEENKEFALQLNSLKKSFKKKMNNTSWMGLFIQPHLL